MILSKTKERGKRSRDKSWEPQSEMDIYGRKRVNDWLNEKNRPKELTRKNLEYVRELNQIEREFSRLIVIAYLLITEFNMNGLRQIFLSAQRQKKFVQAVKLSLKEYGVETEWHKVFDRDIESLRKRLDHAFKIIVENIRLTESYPYFKNVGFDKLIDFSIDYIKAKDNDDTVIVNQLKEEIEEYNASHQQEIVKHMESVKDEIEVLERHRAKIEADKKAEKRARKLAKKEADAEVREIKKNNEKHRKEQRKIDRSFGYLFK